MDIKEKALEIARRYEGTRTYKALNDYGLVKEYKITLKLETDEDTGSAIVWQTSFPQYEAGFHVPETWAELVNLKMREQLWNASDIPGDIALAYYFEVMRACGG